ncbi:hypothetical protein M0802_003332 [Mischocyttarus mexicanus]|nr:hypothetical protein M0802_003332 [Mischocyttarus mexicanus]
MLWLRPSDIGEPTLCGFEVGKVCILAVNAVNQLVTLIRHFRQARGGLLVIVALATILVTVLAGDTPITPIPTVCPSEDSPDFTVHLRHENDCTKFYKCLAGEKILNDCPYMNKAKTRRLHFNPLLQVCDFPSKAGCSGTVVPTETTETTKPSQPTNPPSVKTCENSPEGTQVQHESRCHLYYKCTLNGKQLLECPEGSNFNPVTEACDNSNSCRLTNVCRYHRSSEGQYYPHPTSCKKVYYCKGNTETIYDCDENAEWNEEAGQCMRADLAHCKRRFNYFYN